MLRKGDLSPVIQDELADPECRKRDAQFVLVGEPPCILQVGARDRVRQARLVGTMVRPVDVVHHAVVEVEDRAASDAIELQACTPRLQRSIQHCTELAEVEHQTDVALQM
ncbi:hypothetical protein I6F36_33955 [Bradyrhizobium sp. BRP19]|uniref:hypothetical protein n=1 Tax=Bradyrhizobium sp. BRP19 TaxID=2793823 RepID=UPI001CD7FB80|nr:hypothetical protein [Bradyrhizobium sp. BRP19]MCA1551805.1 hypothetical protein [Bradyrhizobium sp. BRP19]